MTLAERLDAAEKAAQAVDSTAPLDVYAARWLVHFRTRLYAPQLRYWSGVVNDVAAMCRMRGWDFALYCDAQMAVCRVGAFRPTMMRGEHAEARYRAYTALRGRIGDVATAQDNADANESHRLRRVLDAYLLDCRVAGKVFPPPLTPVAADLLLHLRVMRDAAEFHRLGASRLIELSDPVTWVAVARFILASHPS